MDLKGCSSFCLILIFIINYTQPIQLIPKGLSYCMNRNKSHILFNPVLKKINKTHVSFSGEAKIKSTLDDSFTIGIDIARKSPINNKWVNNIFNVKLKHLCADIIKMAPGLFPSFWKSVPKTNLTSCPIPKGTYDVKNFIPHIDVPAPATPPGQYKGTANIYNNKKEKIFCIDVLITMI